MNNFKVINLSSIQSDARTNKLYESADYYSDDFDYQQDFTQFLQEARKNACKETSNTAQQKGRLDGEKQNKKSWRKSLFSWLKKSKSTARTSPGHGHVSGPVQRTGGGNVLNRAAVSGPLTGFFSSRRRVEDYEVPYMYLGGLNNTQRIHSYGPVYLVE